MAILALLATSLVAQLAVAREALVAPGEDPRAEAESLDALLRQGMQAYWDGDLSGSDQVWARVRELYPEHPAAATFELATLQSRRSLDYWGGQYEQSIHDRAQEAVSLSLAW